MLTWWKGLRWWTKAAVILGAVIVLIIVIGVVSPAEETTETAVPSAPTATPTPTTSPTAAAETPPPPEPTPTATPTPTPTATPTPTVAQCPTAEELDWLADLGGTQELLGEVLAVDLVPLLEEFAADPTVLYDDNWRTLMALTLVIIESIADNYEALDPPSERTQAIQDDIDIMATHLRLVTVFYTQGFDHLDASEIEAGNNSITEATAWMVEVAGQLETLCE